jgi:hypothetical protein
MFTSECSGEDAGFNLNPTKPNPNAVPGDPDTLEGVALTQTVDVELDLTRDVADPMVNTLKAQGQRSWWIQTTIGWWKMGRLKGARILMSSCKRLQSAAPLRQSKQSRSPCCHHHRPSPRRLPGHLAAVDTGVPANLEPEDGTDLELLHDRLQPNKAAKPLDG